MNEEKGSDEPSQSSKEYFKKLYPHFPTQEESDKFYASMGRAIANWQRVEAALYEVYRACTGSTRPGAEACAFYSVTSFKTKWVMVEEALKFICENDHKILKEWKKIRENMDKKYKWRNEIAHGNVWTALAETRSNRKIYVGPDAYDFRRKKSEKQPGNPPEPITLDRIKECEANFLRLADSILLLLKHIPRAPAH